MTVSKIFILSQAEVLPTLEKFVDLDNIPGAYGGSLDWSFGQLPHLDDAAAAQCDKSGNGWMLGPVLWKDERRIPVGTVKGVLRTSEVEAKQSVELNGTVKTPKSTVLNEDTTEHINAHADLPAEMPSNKDTLAVENVGEPPAQISAEHPPPTDGDEKLSPIPQSTSDTSPIELGEKTDSIDAKQINGIVKPPIERFETAPENMPRVNGVVN